ncbi:type II toxin-antitoxin system VapC family toxin [Ectothiorhodospiraceae bacterium 2226]|nr:type II toxin-antitoxin system VapC family toxin [Ectothiorhodospiraceae bacterium 2226]
MLYLDTSLLVAALTNEARTSDMQTWLAAQDPEALFISEWVITEFSAALSAKVRVGHIGASHRADALAVFTALTERSFGVLAVSRAEFRAAARFADQHAIGLRAGDALHLAVAANHGARLCSLDRTLVNAGDALGVSTAFL